jgi:hypothetical protein
MKQEIIEMLLHKEYEDLLNTALLVSNTDKEAFDFLNDLHDKAVSKLWDRKRDRAA